ncbi:MAG: ATP-binding protein [Thermodesulfobacteriota bacterium]
MAGPLRLNSSPEEKKRRRERILIALILCLVVTLTSLEIYLLRRGGYPLTGSLLAFGLLNLNAILFLLLTFLIFRNLAKLFLERRRKVFGSRLRTRLVLTFISLALLPTLFMFFIAWQLISTRVDYQRDNRLEEALEMNLTLGRDVSQSQEDKLRACGRLFGRELREAGQWSQDPSKALVTLLSRWRESYGLTGVEMLDAAGAPLAASYDPSRQKFPAVSLPAWGPGREAQETFQRQAVPGGGLLSLIIPLAHLPDQPQSYLVLRQFTPRSLLSQIKGAERRLEEFQQMQLLIRPVRVSHYLALVIVTLLALTSAIWLAFYMAREITTPVRQLAEGTLKVAGGDYDFHIDQEGKDEIGFLVQSFNKMTLDLQQSRAQLAAAYEQLRQSHAELEASKRHMEILLRNVAAGVIGLDTQGRVTSINDSAAQMLNLGREEVLGQDGRSLIPPGEYSRLADLVSEARRDRGTVERPFHLALPDRTLYLLVKATVLKDETGQDLGVVMVFEDLTELERAQRQAAWREVARRIAHEVKNPLTPIKLAAQRLRRRYLDKFADDGKIFDECTQIISDQADEIKNLVNEFSHFARLPHLNLSLQDLNALIQETLPLYQELQSQITLTFHPDPHLPPLLLDREQIKRMLLNLVDNALASIPGSGSIILSTEEEGEAQWVRLIVADTGSGIPEPDKARIFEPYFSTKRGGTGLGLAIVQSIVMDHQGHIHVEDNQPQGTRFIIDLPVRREPYAGNHPSS